MGRDQAVTVIAGIGCRAGCPAEDIVALVRQASASAGAPVTALAAAAFKAGEPGLHRAAITLGVPLLLIGRDRLDAVQKLCPTHSAPATRATGIASVAEGSALAAAGSDGRLILPLIAGPRATCALAEAP